MKRVSSHLVRRGNMTVVPSLHLCKPTASLLPRARVTKGRTNLTPHDHVVSKPRVILHASLPHVPRPSHLSRSKESLTSLEQTTKPRQNRNEQPTTQHTNERPNKPQTVSVSTAERCGRE